MRVNYVYSVSHGRMTVTPPAPAVRWRKKGCAHCKPIVVPTKPTINPLPARHD